MGSGKRGQAKPDAVGTGLPHGTGFACFALLTLPPCGSGGVPLREQAEYIGQRCLVASARARRARRHAPETVNFPARLSAHPASGKGGKARRVAPAVALGLRRADKPDVMLIRVIAGESLGILLCQLGKVTAARGPVRW